MKKVCSVRPDLIFVDIRLIEASGLELARKITANYPGTKVIIMTSYNSMGYQELAAQYGAKDFFLKAMCPERIFSLYSNPFSL